MHSKWGIIAVLAGLAAAVLITMSISGCPGPPEQEPVIIEEVPPEDIAPPVEGEAVTNEPTEAEEGAEIAPPEGAEGVEGVEGAEGAEGAEGVEGAEGADAPPPDEPPVPPPGD